MSLLGMLGDALAQMPVLPPRPNPGPEPWPPPWALYGPWLTTALAVVWLGSAAWWIYRRDRRRVSEQERAEGPFQGRAQGPLVIWSDRVRDHLDIRLGPGRGRRTTVEIANDPAVTAQFGPEQAEALVAFLKAADRAKFANDPTFEPESIATWTEWAAGFVDSSGTQPGLVQKVAQRISDHSRIGFQEGESPAEPSKCAARPGPRAPGKSAGPDL